MEDEKFYDYSDKIEAICETILSLKQQFELRKILEEIEEKAMITMGKEVKP
jgi:hypothetical protein